MAPPDERAWRRLADGDHAVLATVHPARGVDAVPVVYAVHDGHVGIPIDLIKPKSSTRLQRERNLAADPRATLLVEHWDADDWTRLWWVRAELRWVGEDAAGREDALAELLEQRYAQYAGRPFARILVLRVVRLTGWSAAVSPDVDGA
ncbi:pyridoxamine 5'-phosphate oxidase family protein [Gordonia phosphorivorans]|uniref:Pyridoxamine 5'-phosphate oxidase family protein n=1 Tax=Gordonia phosphorivorans TaxID=1056982 RepID=A0ABV6H988_9ACTN